MIELTDPALRLLLLGALVRDPSGLSDAQAAELRALSSAELVKLSEMREPRLTVAVEGSLAIGIKRAEAIQARDELARHFVEHGATNDMMHRLFHWSSVGTEATPLRRAVGITLRRPTMPKQKGREAIQARWYAMRKGAVAPIRAEELEALRREFPDCMFNTLWAVIHEFEKPAETPKRQYRKCTKLTLVA